jgi:serine phosphatase RsbU (regulator of sigma subunit)
MLTAPIPQDESERLADLDQLELMYSKPEAMFDRVTAQLAEVFGAPSVMMSLIDSDTQYVKSMAGFPAEMMENRTLDRKNSVCGHVLGQNEVMVVEDLQADARFVDNPVVKAKGLRFYAGAPLRTDAGHAIGALCVVDFKPRKISQREKLLLMMVANELMTQIKLRSTSQKLLERTRVIERDLAAARVVQRFLLPPTSQEGKGFGLWHYYHPFAAIGGDFLDTQIRPDGSLALLIADVSGHGASAALTSAMVKTIFQRAAGSVSGPDQLLTAIEADLSRTVENGQFMTAAAMVFDPAMKAALLASAGHPLPILLRDGKAQAVKTVNDLPLLIEPGQIYGQHTAVKLNAGDRLFYYTDGASEAADQTGELLGIEGLMRLIQANAHLCCSALLEALFHGVRSYANGRLSDDVALVCLEVR